MVLKDVEKGPRCKAPAKARLRLTSKYVEGGPAAGNAADGPLSTSLETFSNPKPNRNYTITMECPEFTCVCPKTGQPDFATIRITYVPHELCLELKSIKLYLWSYRQAGAFHEKVINQILDDLVTACQPRSMTVEGDFNIRGGIHTKVIAQYPDL